MKFTASFIALFLLTASCTENETSELRGQQVQETTTENIDSIDLSQNGLTVAFELIDPDTAMIRKKVWKDNYVGSMGYTYLTSYYQATSEKDSIIYYDEESKDLCAFYQTFDYGITYSKSSCEEVGFIEQIKFPKIDNKSAKAFVNKLFYDSWNTWTTDLNYEADGAGCYYTINQEEHYTIIDIWCGC